MQSPEEPSNSPPNQPPLSSEKPRSSLSSHERDKFRDSYTLYAREAMEKLRMRLGSCPTNCLIIGNDWDFLLVYDKNGDLILRPPIVKTPTQKSLTSTLISVETMLKNETGWLGKDLTHFGQEGFVVIDCTRGDLTLDTSDLSQVETTDYGLAGLIGQMPIHIIRQDSK